MSGNKLRYLLDTNAIIYILDQGLVLKSRNKYSISIITEIELLSYSKLTRQEYEQIKNALHVFESLNITEAIKEQTIMIRRMRKIKLPDSIIIASAIEEHAVLITHDQQLVKSALVACQSLENILE